ncbi:hypothetical protein H2198_005548 [Neophaeococcomyces mojaviensis]|uniref:Uncharacterized protein n=1 Tax=Neophaeococcomyces mojaviensis TaxID=3383035 RepID=A0ACC3A5M4_9EURO|nr:hypothetical protein H2198_005548 [Knufia sp. JES_112]
MEKLLLSRQADDDREKVSKVHDSMGKADVMVYVQEEPKMSQDQQKLLHLRRTTSSLEETLAHVDEQLRQKNSALKDLNTYWESKTQDMKQKIETEIKNQFERAETTSQQQLQQRYRAAEARAQELEAKLRSSEQQDQKVHEAEVKAADALSKVELQRQEIQTYLQQLELLKGSNAGLTHTLEEGHNNALEQMKASHTAEIDEARRLLTFFKSNSERVSRKNQEAMAENRKLQQSLVVKTQQVEEQSSVISALRRRN